MAQDLETGKPRGFAHIDFFDKDIAERAVEELTNLDVQGRALKLDLEREKRPREAEASERGIRSRPSGAVDRNKFSPKKKEQ